MGRTGKKRKAIQGHPEKVFPATSGVPMPECGPSNNNKCNCGKPVNMSTGFPQDRFCLNRHIFSIKD